MEKQGQTNQELKQKHWKEIKKDFISKIPKEFKIETNGIDDNSIYYHPKIILTDGYFIESQCDLNSKRIYAFSLRSENKQIINNMVYPFYANINDDEKLFYFLNHYSSLLKKIQKSESEIMKIYSLIEKLSGCIEKMKHSAIEEIIDKEELKKSIRSLEEVTEYLENQRYIGKSLMV